MRRLAAPFVAGDMRGRVLARLRARRPAPDVDAIAAELHVGARTLQRRLADEGTSFTDVVDETPRDIAPELLDGDATLDRIAAAVGFLDSSVLVRAFRRWTGRTPRAHRADARAR